MKKDANTFKHKGDYNLKTLSQAFTYIYKAALHYSSKRKGSLRPLHCQGIKSRKNYIFYYL